MYGSLRPSNWLVLILLGSGLLGISWSVMAESATGFRLGTINGRLEKPDHALRRYGQLHAYVKAKMAEQGLPAGALVIARDINGMSDLTGKTIVFEGPGSTSAYSVPKAALQAEGLNLKSIESPSTRPGTRPSAGPNSGPSAVRYLFAGSELNQADWVHRGRADVGAFNDGDWDRLPNTIKQDLKVRSKLIEILLSAPTDETGRDALQTAARIARIESLSDADKSGIEYWSTILTDQA